MAETDKPTPEPTLELGKTLPKYTDEEIEAIMQEILGPKAKVGISEVVNGTRVIFGYIGTKESK